MRRILYMVVTNIFKGVVGMKRVRQVMIILTALFLLGFHFGPNVVASLIEPGSEDDPLVTKTWVDQYIAREFSTVKNKVENLSKEVAILDTALKEGDLSLHPEIKLTIGQKIAFVGEQEKILDTPPCIVGGRTLLPLRFIGEILGANFTWNNELKKVTYILGNNTVELIVGRKEAIVNGQAITLDVPADIVNGRTMVPLRFIGEALGTSVTWIGETKTVVIR